MENRTYGIEIEMASKADHLTLAMAIQTAFDLANMQSKLGPKERPVQII